VYWAYNLKAQCAFITRDNINTLISQSGLSGDIGLLSIDIDGNDFWIWEAITCINPRIFICEYNSLFGSKAQVTIPYDPNFIRDEAHFSKVYYGASIAALSEISAKKGYSLVASNKAGNNVFFVRKDLMGDLKELLPEEAYRQAEFRECHNERGFLTFVDFNSRLSTVLHLDVYNMKTESIMKINEIKEIVG
jgi:hypothetical protein